MIECFSAFAFLVAAVAWRDPLWAMAAGLFAIAANLNLIYHKED